MATMSSSTASSSSTREADAKISNNLVILKEKMDLLDALIHPNDISAPKLSVKTNEAVRSVVGYLDACGPRIGELVTVCMSHDGVLSEAVFGDVLGCNDRLQRLLSDFDTMMMTETGASTTVAGGGASAVAAASASGEAVGPSDLTEQFGDLLLGSEDPFAESHGGTFETSKPPYVSDQIQTTTSILSTTPPSSNLAKPAGAKTTGETSEDFWAGALASAPPVPPVASSAAASSATKTETNDPFDDFFAERTESNFD